MGIAAGVEKELRAKAMGSYHTAPGASSAQLKRRVSSNLSLTKDTFGSNEKVRHQQRVDKRHGMRRVGGTIAGLLSAGTYEDEIAAVLRKAFVATADITGLAITIAASGDMYTITRGSGSWLTDGIKVGDVVRLTAGSFTAGNSNNNLVVVNVIALVLTVYVLNGSSLTAEGPISSSTLSVPGKKSWTPLTGHTDVSFAYEHYFSDIGRSELFLDCKPAGMTVNLPPGDNAQIAFDMLGSDMTPAGAEYFTTPTAETETGIVTAVSGFLALGGSKVVNVTGLSLAIACGTQAAGPVHGQNYAAAITRGRLEVDGQLTAYLQNGDLSDYFDDETEVELIIVAAASPANAADFVSFVMSKVKINSDAKDDPDQSITQTASFSALLNGSGGAGTEHEETTLSVQDSQA
jgi:hypothetical protein